MPRKANPMTRVKALRRKAASLDKRAATKRRMVARAEMVARRATARVAVLRDAASALENESSSLRALASTLAGGL